MSLRSPLARVMGLGAAGSGTHHWWQQRMTAVALVILGAWFAVGLLGLEVGDRQAVLAWVGQPLNAALLVLLVATSAWHSQLGTRVIVEDYLKGAFRLSLLVALPFAHALATAVGVIAVLQIAIGGR